MTGLVRKATLFAVCGLLAASAAFASVPSPANSTTPPCVRLVGNNGATADPAGTFTVTVRDLANLPINNSLVVIDFSGCSGLVICNSNAFDAASTVDCGTQTVRKFTGVGGSASFTILGHANNSGGNQPPYGSYNSGKIFADGVLLGSPSVSAFDHDGGGLGPADLAAWLGDFFNGNNPSRSDYDCTGAPLGPSDLSAWLGVFFGGGSGQNCPGNPVPQCSVIP
jgi:hypothetical protein